MEASPRDNEETTVDDVQHVGRVGPAGRVEDRKGLHGLARDLPSYGFRVAPGGVPGDGSTGDDSVSDDGTDGEGMGGDSTDAGLRDGADAPAAVDPAAEEPQELRPQRKLRAWQLAPIVMLGALGSLMFAFPLAFEPGGGTGAVVSMLGLLICSCAAGWGVMAARRVGLTWPGLPARGSDERTDWRIVLLYAVIVGTAAALAIWRVARLR